MARKIRKFAQGGDASQHARYARKVADIESDYQKALKAGRSNGIATAKYEQRMADARDDLAKWTRSDRTETRAAERAAEMALSEARRTKGVSALRSKTPAVLSSYMDEGPVGVTPGAEVGRVAPPSTARAAPRRRVAPPAPAPRREAPAPTPHRAAAPTPTRAERPPFVKDFTPQDLAALGTRKTDADWDAALAKTPRLDPRWRAALAAKAWEDRERAAGRLEGSTPPDPRWASALAKGVPGMKCGGKTKKFAKGGSVDGCAVRGKTKLRKK